MTLKLALLNLGFTSDNLGAVDRYRKAVHQQRDKLRSTLLTVIL